MKHTNLSKGASVFLFALTTLAFASSAYAADPFFTCDGLKKPGPNDDMLATDPERGQSVLWSEPRSWVGPLDLRGAAACDLALADERLKPTYVQRRADLLQAKAAHLLGGGKVAEALDTLDVSDRVGSHYPPLQFQQGIGLGNRILRGIALNLAGRREEASVELEKAYWERPWASSIAGQLLEVSYPSASSDTRLKLLKRAAVLNPDIHLIAMGVALQQRDFPSVSAMGAGPSPEPLPDFQGYRDEKSENAEPLKLMQRTERVGMRAYALCALSHCDEAEQELRAIEELLNQPNSTAQNSRRNGLISLVSAKNTGLEIISTWRRLISLRIKLSSFQLTPELVKNANLDVRRLLFVLPDMIEQARKSKFPVDPAFSNIAVGSDLSGSSINSLPEKIDVSLQYNNLPNVETSIIRPRYRPTTKKILSLGSGFTSVELPETNEMGVYFVDFNASQASVEEAALYAAATLAKSKGFDSIVVTYNGIRNRRVTGPFINEAMGRAAYLRFKCVHKADDDPETGYGFRIVPVEEIIAGVGGNLRQAQ